MNGSVAYLVTAAGCLIAVAGIVVAVVALRRTRTRPSRHPGPTDPFRDRDADALRGDPRRLRPGDIVEIRRVPYTLRGSVELREGSWTWWEHFLDDASGGQLWLSVEEDPDLELVLWRTDPDAALTPGAPTVDFDGRRFTKEESGHARFTGTGTTGLDPTGAMRYFDYRSPDGARLSFEAFGDAAWEVSRGDVLHRSDVMIYPQADPGKVG
ncbi:hypothetical protein C5N14_10990 [Micromonospora sp. MW-13]|uniref:DUF4178 domain-containing protein n=1 Tax=Micromonospora sp. MW-13 TaxID=2094022 RepID=UPI000E43E348|nr:DUF4178 domain-containing protein [Micromonospora sp. MW-13]RGC69067.1 hypothetical protein C5N14_10990 [Micromonospora sp. MW-13]